MARKSLVPAGYPALLTRVKERVRTAQIKAALSANRELILLYWDIGHAIVEAQKDKGYGRRVVEVLSVDLRREFPTMTGLSALNLWRMRAFYLANASNQKLSQPVTESDFRRHRIVKQTVSEIVAQPVRDSSPSILSQPVTESAGAIELMTSLPWGHNIVLTQKVKQLGTRLWYARAALENGW
jgi:predicted nuclease of restriction endonuclease-like (RecB) superfamily